MRLQEIAYGNPDVAKVGAFGIGMCTMFSIYKEPLVVSGGQSLLFLWKGDALWMQVALHKLYKSWMSFVLPLRDLYTFPNWNEFGTFLCHSLTYTQSLQHMTVYVNPMEML